MCRTDTCDSNLPRPLYASRPAYFDPSFTSWRERGGGQVVRWVYNLQGKTRMVIPCRNAATLVCGPQCSSSRSSHIIHRIDISTPFWNLDTQIEYKPAFNVLCRLL